MKKLMVLLFALFICFTFSKTIKAEEIDFNWGIPEMKVDEVHNKLNLKGQGIKIAVIDGGIDFTNTEFDDIADRIVGYNAITDISSFLGIYEDFDESGNISNHGTLVSGLIASKRYGVSPNVDLYVVRTNNDQKVVARGINWAVDQNVDIISISKSVANEDSDIEAALIRARNANIIVVVAAGNIPSEYTDGDSPLVDNVQYPARSQYAIAIGATEKNHVTGEIKRSTRWDMGTKDESGNTLLSASATGPKIEVVAPGTYVPRVTTQSWRDQHNKPDSMVYEFVEGGTSSATPYVAGVLGLLIQQYPELHPKVTGSIEDIVSKMKSCTKKDLVSWGFGYESYFSREFGSGFVQALCEEPIDIEDEITTNTSLTVFEAPTKAEYTDFSTISPGTYKVDMIWKKKTDGTYEWYRIQVGTDYYWVKGDYRTRLDWTKTEGFNLIPSDDLYMYPSLNASKISYASFGINNTSYRPAYAIDCYEKCTTTDANKKRYRWYQIDINGTSYWYYKDYENYQATSTNNGFDDQNIQEWEDYIGSSLVSLMKDGYYNNTASTAFFEEAHLFNKEEYTNILNLYSNSYSYKYFVHASKGTNGSIKELYLAFSNSPLYFMGSSIKYIKSQDGTAFRIVDPHNYYNDSYRSSFTNSYSGLSSFVNFEFIPITDQSFYEENPLLCFLYLSLI